MACVPGRLTQVGESVTRSEQLASTSGEWMRRAPAFRDLRPVCDVRVLSEQKALRDSGPSLTTGALWGTRRRQLRQDLVVLKEIRA